MASAGWYDAPFDIIHLISRSLPISDLVRFGAVCKSWRSVLLESNWFGCGQAFEALNMSPRHHPKLLLNNINCSGDTRNFFDLTTNRSFQLPMLKARNRQVFGSNNGWVVTFGIEDEVEIHLINLITRQQIQLPSLPLKELGLNEVSKEDLLDLYLGKAVILDRPDSDGGWLVAVVRLGLVAVVKPMVDKSWTVLSCDCVSDAIYHKRCLYFISRHIIPHLYIYDLNNISNGLLQIDMSGATFDFPLLNNHQCYLVEVGGELVAVGRFHYMLGKNYYSSKVTVFKAENERWRVLNSLPEDCCLFLGDNTSVALSPVPPGFQSNCIYFTGDLYYSDNRGRDRGVYSLHDDAYREFQHENSPETFMTGIWVTLNPDYYVF